MASHKNILKHRTYWDFMNRIADMEKNQEPFDQTTTNAFADFLDEQGDRRGLLARLATRHHLSDSPFGGVDAVHPSHPRQVGTAMIHRVPDPDVPALPLSAYQDNSHSGIELHAHHAGIPARGSYPVLHWRQHIPKTVSTLKHWDAEYPRIGPAGVADSLKRISRTARLTAPVTPDQLHDFIDAMPNGQTKTRWRAAAHQNGWHRSTGPTKLARITVQPGRPAGHNQFVHDVHDESGQRIGGISVHHDGGDTLHVPFAGLRGMGDDRFNSLGPGVIREGLRQLKAHYPAAKKLVGLRIGGAKPANTGEPQETQWKLARDSNRDPLIHSVYAATPEGDLTPSAVFADHLSDTNTPGEQVVREAVAHGDRFRSDLDERDPLDNTPFPHRVIVRGHAGDDESPYKSEYMWEVYHARPGSGFPYALNVRHSKASPGWPIASHTVGVKSLGHLAHLMKDFPKETKLHALTSLREHEKGTRDPMEALAWHRPPETMPTRLARNADRDPLIHAIRQAGGDRTPSAVFADHLEDTNTPGQHIVRAHANDLDPPQTIGALIAAGHDPEWSWSVHPQQPHDEEYPHRVLSVQHDVSEDDGPDVTHSARVHSLRGALPLVRDFPRDHIKRILTALKQSGLPNHEPSERDRRIWPMIRAGNVGAVTRLADYLERTGEPGAHILREAHKNIHAGRGSSIAEQGVSPTGTYDFAESREQFKNGYPHWRVGFFGSHDGSTPQLTITHHGSGYHRASRTAYPEGGYLSNHFSQHTVPVRDQQHLYELLQDFHPDVFKKMLRTAVLTGLPRKVKLARDSNRDPLIESINRAKGDMTPSLAFADHLDETGTPGQHVVRAATGTGMADALFGDGHDGATNIWHGRSAATAHLYGLPGDPGGKSNRDRLDTSEVVPILRANWQQHDDNPRTVRVVVAHTPGGEHTEALSAWHGATAHNMHELLHLISDFPAEHQEGMLSAARAHWTRHDPTRLARVTPEQRSGLGNAVRTLGTDNHEERARIAQQVMQEAGLRAAVRAAIAVDGPDTRPAHVIAVHGATSPEHVAYAAAWYGLLSGERALRVFHPGEGKDILHVMDAPVPADHAVQYMQRAGIPSFAVERRGSGSRVYAQHNEDLSHLAKGLNARHSTIRGTVSRLGAGQSTGPDSGAESRSDFRSTIRAAESAADTGPVSP